MKRKNAPDRPPTNHPLHRHLVAPSKVNRHFPLPSAFYLLPFQPRPLAPNPVLCGTRRKFGTISMFSNQFQLFPEGIPHPESSFNSRHGNFWNLELGTWNLELGTWNLELGISVALVLGRFPTCPLDFGLW